MNIIIPIRLNNKVKKHASIVKTNSSPSVHSINRVKIDCRNLDICNNICRYQKIIELKLLHRVIPRTLPLEAHSSQFLIPVQSFNEFLESNELSYHSMSILIIFVSTWFTDHTQPQHLYEQNFLC